MKIALGTANFGMPYGILNQSNNCLNGEEVHSILDLARSREIDSFDTAYGYGTSWEILKDYFKKNTKNHPKIINKFSVKDNYEKLFNSIKADIEEMNINSFYALLIHDPQNIKEINADNLKIFINKILSAGLIKKVGVSVYSFEEVEEINNIFPLDIIQCPINPFNQKFLHYSFQNFCEKNNIEVHARSLFLQGILLASDLPNSLEPFKPYWQTYCRCIEENNMPPLEALMIWANNKNFVNKWILGVSSTKDLRNILLSIENLKNQSELINFDELARINHPYIDPRNWPN